MRSSHRQLSLLFILVLSVVPSVLSQARPELAPDDETPLAIEDTADLLGVRHSLQMVQGRQPGGRAGDQADLLFAQQKLIASVTAASLQVDATAGQIDEEIAEARELQNYMSARRQREVDLLNLVSLGIGGSLGTASAALGLTPHAQASGVVGIVSGTSITALSVVGLHVRKGGKDVLETPSNMLSRVFALPADPNDFYPPLVAAFMEKSAPNDPPGVSRKLHMVRAWQKLGRIPDPDTAKGKAKIARLASLPQQDMRLSIGDLDDRQAMLYDLRARILYLKRDLALLMTAASENMRE